MASVEQAFASLGGRISSTHGVVLPILSAYCESKKFLLAHRTKSLDSVREKLETGRYASIAALDDILAYSVIVDIADQEREVITFLKENFLIDNIKKGTSIRDERMFGFDCTRVYCRPKRPSNPLSSPAEVLVEVQVRTLLQHAWSKITHELVYKTARLDSRASRLAAEVMAQIESIDRTFARFAAAKRSVKKVTRKEIAELDHILDIIDALVEEGIVPSLFRPSNGRRLAENIRAIAQPNKVEEAAAAIDAFIRALPSFPTSLSVYQLSLVAMTRSKLVRKQPPHLLVTDTMISLYPEMSAWPKQVSLDVD